MTLTMLPRFWKTLDELPGATSDALDWKARLGDEYDAASRYLRRTGDIAVSVDCPSPGGDGCPRRVVKMRNGGLRAVCRSTFGRCEPIELSHDDVAVMALDHKALVGDLVQILPMVPTKRTPDEHRVVLLGQHGVAAGISSPILLALPGPHDPISDEELRAAGLTATPAIVLVPQYGSLPRELRARLAAAGHLVLDLASISGIGVNRRLGLAQSYEILLAPVRDAMLARLNATSGTPRIALPPDARWAELTFALISDDLLNVSFRGQNWRLVPEQLGMKDRRSGSSSESWALLQVLASVGGIMGPLGRDVVDDQKKKKQILARRLIQTFGITAEPIRWNSKGREYQTTFVIRDERPKSVRERAGRR